VLSEKVTFHLFGNVLRHNFISHGSNKPHSDIARTHKGHFHVTCVLCFVFCPSSIVMTSLRLMHRYCFTKHTYFGGIFHIDRILKGEGLSDRLY